LNFVLQLYNSRRSPVEQRLAYYIPLVSCLFYDYLSAKEEVFFNSDNEPEIVCTNAEPILLFRVSDST